MQFIMKILQVKGAYPGGDVQPGKTEVECERGEVFLRAYFCNRSPNLLTSKNMMRPHGFDCTLSVRLPKIVM